MSAGAYMYTDTWLVLRASISSSSAGTVSAQAPHPVTASSMLFRSRSQAAEFATATVRRRAGAEASPSAKTAFASSVSDHTRQVGEASRVTAGGADFGEDAVFAEGLGEMPAFFQGNWWPGEFSLGSVCIVMKRCKLRVFGHVVAR